MEGLAVYKAFQISQESTMLSSSTPRLVPRSWTCTLGTCLGVVGTVPGAVPLLDLY